MMKFVVSAIFMPFSGAYTADLLTGLKLNRGTRFLEFAVFFDEHFYSNADQGDRKKSKGYQKKFHITNNHRLALGYIRHFLRV